MDVASIWKVAGQQLFVRAWMRDEGIGIYDIIAFRTFTENVMTVCFTSFMAGSEKHGLCEVPEFQVVARERFEPLLKFGMVPRLCNPKEWIAIWNGERLVSATSMLAYPILQSLCQGLFCMNFSTTEFEGLRADLVRTLEKVTAEAWKQYRLVNC